MYLLLRLRLLWRVLRDPRTPALSKLLPWLAIGYVLLPADLITDLFAVVGWLDDLGVLALLLSVAWKHAPREVRAWHKKQIETGDGGGE